MARLPRLDLPNVPQHIVQRGNNRLPCFLHDEDRQRYLQLLHEALLHNGCALHAYVLMSNHVHLLVTPPEVGAISRLMQKLGRQYVGAFNALHRRTGTLWEGRYKSCLVDSESYVLRCYRYIDLNPVRARMTDDALQFEWSSAAAHAGHRSNSLLTDHSAFQALGINVFERGLAYQRLLEEVVSEDELAGLRSYLQQQRALGCDAFKAMVEAKTQRFAGTRPAHRPPAQK